MLYYKRLKTGCFRLPPVEGTAVQELQPVGEGKRSVVYEYIPARLERQVHAQQTLACQCDEGLMTVPGPVRLGDKSQTWRRGRWRRWPTDSWKRLPRST
ncbi:transposase [Melittangium boletus DSM 14713]|uniref:Transposase n=1 Tax=Melittangium boletus DSM 14713 TaxID=1294270 RepID=A0A250IP57_9BACT|nr:transposase [Melittangium boletus DSM 14713]